MGRPRRRLHAGARRARATTRIRSATCCSRLARVYENRAARQRSAPRRRTCSVLSIDPTDSDALAALDRIYEAGGMWQRAGRHPRAAASASPPATEEIIELYFRLGRVTPRRSTTRPRRSRRTTPSSTTTRATGGRSSRSSASTSTTSSGRSCSTPTRRWSTSPPATRAWPTATRAWRRSRQDGLADREKAVDLWGRVIDLRGEDPIALGELANLHERAEQWRELVDVLERTVRITHEPQEQIPLYQRLGRIWGEKLHRERNSLEAWQKVLEIDPDRHAGAARAGRRLQVDAGVGRAGRDAAQADRHRLDHATWSRAS